jgi:DNA-binding transcriptional ArsR family regulator
VPSDVTEKGRRELRAWAHPLRLRMLSLLTGVALSAAEVARELGTTQANASYHLRHLEAAGLLEVVEVVAVRGGRARRYRHVPGSAEGELPADGPVPAAVSEATWRAMAAELGRRAALAGPMRPDGQLLADAELWVSQEDWQAVVHQVHEAMTRLHERARPPRAPGTVPVAATVALFALRADADVRPGAGLGTPSRDTGEVR